MKKELIGLFLKMIAIWCMAALAAGFDRLLVEPWSTPVIYTIYGFLVADVVRMGEK